MTRLSIPILIVLGAAGCADNPCQDFVDSVDRASKVSGCTAYTQQFRDRAAAIDVDNCSVGTADEQFQEHVSSCLDLIQTSCDAAVQAKVSACLSR
jgi:hypothetical protein